MSRIPEGFGQALVKEGLREAMAPTIVNIVADRIRWPAGGGIPVVLGLDGQPRDGATVSDIIREMRAAYPEAWAGADMPEPEPEPTTLTARAKAEDAARKASEAQAAGEAPNPWAAGTRNLTEQVRLTARDPERAARLRAEVGA